MDIDLIFKIAAVGIIVSILNQVLVRSGREEQATMTSLAALVVVLMIVVQRIAELFDLSIQPHPTTMEQVEKYKADAKAAYEAERAAERAEQEAICTMGYQEYVNYRLGEDGAEWQSYILYDLNGDGVEELIIRGVDILSMKDGESYRYFDMIGAAGSSIRGFAPCEKGVFEMYTDEIFRMCQYNYYRANLESAESVSYTHLTLPTN